MQKKINIDISIYPVEKIKKAIIDYKDAAVIKLEKNNLVIYGESEKEIDEIFLEFCNYVIGLIN